MYISTLRLIIFCVATIAASAHAQSPDESLVVYAVNINQTPKQSWPGYGIYLGRGLVITAAHVVGRASETRPTVSIAGKELVAEVIKEGDFETIDLTLLSIDETQLPVSLRLRREPICTSDPWVGQAVVVAIPTGIARSHIISPKRISANLRERFSTLIGDVATTGNSGSGVFDERRKCLLGIMSRKIQKIKVRNDGQNFTKEAVDIAKYFVPASVIRGFIPARFSH